MKLEHKNLLKVSGLIISLFLIAIISQPTSTGSVTSGDCVKTEICEHYETQEFEYEINGNIIRDSIAKCVKTREVCK
jgi:hypothetical protein